MTASVSDLMAFGMSPYLASRLGNVIVTGAAAVGTTQAGATLLSGTIISVTTVTATNNAVVLPTDAQLANSGYGTAVRVTNGGTSQLQVFPPLGASINGLAANASFSMDVGASFAFQRVSTTSWSTSVGDGTVSTGLTAAGTNAGTALVLTTLNSELTTVGSGTGAILPTYMGIGQMAFVANGAAANAALIYPPSGATLYNAGASISVAAGKSVLILRTSATQCYSLLSA